MNNIVFWVLSAVALCGLYLISTYNTLKKSQIKVEEGASGIDVALAKRFDTLTNLVEVVKGYAKHEAETFEHVVQARREMSIAEKGNCESEYSKAQAKLFMVAENYPELKASTNFLQLQKSIVDVEEHLQAARRLYNANASDYNQKIEVFPNSILAKGMKLTHYEFFQASNREKESVKVAIN